MRVFIPQPLRSYTAQEACVEANGATLAEVLASLDASYPGIRFRMIDEQDNVRPHMLLFVNGRRTRSLSEPVAPDEEVVILQALSGG